MIAILVGLIALGALAAVLVWFSTTAYNTIAMVAGVAGAAGAVLTLVGLVVWSACAAQWFGAGHKVRIINETFGTHYTQAEVFWAESVIDEVRELKRQRVELNGDLFRGEKSE